jgi:hypothetical protein
MIEVTHGSIDALGSGLVTWAYMPDVSDIPPDVWDKLQAGLTCGLSMHCAAHRIPPTVI